MGIRFEFFEAGCGDSILVSTDEGTHILIDGGEEGTYKDSIESYLYENNIDKLDLVVLTHIDNDHICGLIELMEEPQERRKIKEIWFNKCYGMRINNNLTEKIGFKEGDLFEKLIIESEIRHRNDIYLNERDLKEKREFYINSNVKLILLSPRKEDIDKLKIDWKKFHQKNSYEIAGKTPYDNRNIDEVYHLFQEKTISKKGKTLVNATNTSLANKSSIAFILEYKDKKFLFLGDSDIKVINQSLNNLGLDKLKFDFIKLSHHGSKKNINKEFLDIVKTDTFIILTDGTRHRHPDKETLALILKDKNRAKNIKFIFNYLQPINYKFPIENNEEERYFFKALYRNTLEYV